MSIDAPDRPCPNHPPPSTLEAITCVACGAFKSEGQPIIYFARGTHDVPRVNSPDALTRIADALEAMLALWKAEDAERRKPSPTCVVCGRGWSHGPLHTFPRNGVELLIHDDFECSRYEARQRPDVGCMALCSDAGVLRFKADGWGAVECECQKAPQ